VRRPGKCVGCEARQQTIVILSDLVDWHRQQMGTTHTSASFAANPPRYTERPRLHTLEDEEDIMAALENGAISSDRANELLAATQAFNTNIEVQ
jgi:hypothetical protein